MDLFFFVPHRWCLSKSIDHKMSWNVMGTTFTEPRNMTFHWASNQSWQLGNHVKEALDVFLTQKAEWLDVVLPLCHKVKHYPSPSSQGCFHKTKQVIILFSSTQYFDFVLFPKLVMEIWRGKKHASWEWHSKNSSHLVNLFVFFFFLRT